MGADITGYFIAKCSGTDKWFAFKEVRDDRSYLWFGIIAGVRTEPHFEPKGYPDIECDVLAPFMGYEYYHSCTHLSLDEMREANEVFAQRSDEEFPEDEAKEQPYQRIPEPGDIVKKLIVNLDYENSSIPWAGTLQQFIGEDANFEESIMFVCAFDS